MSLVLQAWVALAAILFIAEALDPQRLVLPFAVGAATAAVVAWSGGPSSWQWLAFVGVSSVLLVVLQRLKTRAMKTHAAEDEPPAS